MARRDSIVTRKTADQIAIMRRAGRVVAEMHAAATATARAGATTGDIDRACRDVLERRGARSNFLGYHGFPAVACVSVNEVVVHGIPGDRVLHDGDIVSIDCGAIIDGWHADAAITVPIGEIDATSRRLLAVTEAALHASIEQCVVGRRLGDLGAASMDVVRAAGFDYLREYTGHGIGTAMHEPPDVPNYGSAGRGMKLESGLVLAIEPMVTTGRAEVVTLDDDWTVATVDGSRAAHFEHTVAITDDGPEILTLP
jgi:methionyl aminopeptidase